MTLRQVCDLELLLRWLHPYCGQPYTYEGMPYTCAGLDGHAGPCGPIWKRQGYP